MARLRRYVVTFGTCAVLVEATTPGEARGRVELLLEARFPSRSGRTKLSCRPATVADERRWRFLGVAALPAARRVAA